MKATIIIACSAILSLAGCTIQDDIVILEQRLMIVERQNQALQKKLDTELDVVGKSSKSAEKDLRSQYAGLNVNVDTMQEDLRMINGRIEEMDHLIKRRLNDGDASALEMKSHLDEIGLTVAKIDQRMAQIEQYLNFDSSKGPDAIPIPPAKNAAKESPSAKQLYEEAKKAYDKGEMDKARQGFQQVITKHPKSEHSDNAQFWIGESYYREKWFEKAILEYQVVIEKYPKGNKVPAAMLKQGLSFLKLGDKSNARLILKELNKKYPKSNEAQIAAKKLKEF